MKGAARRCISGRAALACVVMNVGASPPEGQVEEGNNNKVGWERLKMINDQVARARRGEPGIEEIKGRERKVSGEKSWSSFDVLENSELVQKTATKLTAGNECCPSFCEECTARDKAAQTHACLAGKQIVFCRVCEHKLRKY